MQCLYHTRKLGCQIRCRIPHRTPHILLRLNNGILLLIVFFPVHPRRAFTQIPDRNNHLLLTLSTTPLSPALPLLTALVAHSLAIEPFKRPNLQKIGIAQGLDLRPSRLAIFCPNRPSNKIARRETQIFQRHRILALGTLYPSCLRHKRNPHGIAPCHLVLQTVIHKPVIVFYRKPKSHFLYCRRLVIPAWKTDLNARRLIDLRRNFICPRILIFLALYISQSHLISTVLYNRQRTFPHGVI